MGGLVCYWWDLKLLQEVWKTGIPTKVEDIMHALQIINSNPRNRSTKIHAHGHQEMCTKMFIPASFTMAPNQK